MRSREWATGASATRNISDATAYTAAHTSAASAPLAESTPGGGTSTAPPQHRQASVRRRRTVRGELRWSGCLSQLPAGWVASNPDPSDGTLWVTSTTTPASPLNDAFIAIPKDGISDKVLDD